jgi:hypothetical protein
MDLNGLLQVLGYLRSERHWVTLEAADSRLAHHYRLAQRAGEEVGEGAKGSPTNNSVIYTCGLTV